jgi:hypothetical protein
LIVSQNAENAVPYMVRYPFDLLRAVSPSTWLRTLRFSKGKVEPLTTNGKSDTYGLSHPFALRYRRVNGPFREAIFLAF